MYFNFKSMFKMMLPKLSQIIAGSITKILLEKNHPERLKGKKKKLSKSLDAKGLVGQVSLFSRWKFFLKRHESQITRFIISLIIEISIMFVFNLW